MAEKSLWNAGWVFYERKLGETDYELPTSALTAWRKIDIPHDWMIDDVHNLYRDSIGWYRKEFEVNELGEDEEICLRFDGIYMDSSIFINGNMVGEWKYGYSTFELEITPFLIKGINQVLVRVVYHAPNTRWYSGAGIYRNVWWKKRKKDHIQSDGIYITPVLDDRKCWHVDVDTEVYFGDGAVEDIYVLKQIICDPSGQVIAEAEYKAEQESDPVFRGEAVFTQQLSGIENPRLWDIGEGNLYFLTTELWKNGVLWEKERQSFGFKIMDFLPDQGFLLNGKKTKINGVCEHHDFGCLGAAFSKEAARKRLLLLRKMGVNAIRTAHNMPAPELMELTDEMGFLVMSEAFDMWEKPKTDYDYARFFSEWYEKDVESWVRRDRNHVSLMMWSIGNEIQDTLDEKRGMEITRDLRDAVRKYDKRNHAPITLGSNFMKWENPKKCASLLDCVGYNYSEYLYEEHHGEHKDWVIFGSETASILSSRGIYHFPLDKAVLTDVDEQCSALGNCITGWGAKSYEDCIGDDRDAEYSMGQFLWTGFDYIGESTPYDTKNSYFGQIDTAGFPKDSFYIFQAEWTDYRKTPMVHVFPYWDFNEGQEIDVQVCSNAPFVELFLNGRSLGKHEIDHKKGRGQIGKWRVPYETGEITAIAYDEVGKEIARKSRRSFGDACEIRVKADKQVLTADGRDLVFVEISVCDRQGNPVENARNRIHVDVSGAGRLLGLDNGDSTDFDSYKGISRRLFGGKLLAVVGSRMEPGEAKIVLSSPGLRECRLQIPVIAGEVDDGVSAVMENRECPVYGGGYEGKNLTSYKEDIPVRKIELTIEGSKNLTKEYDSAWVHARIYPENSTYRELTWKAVNDTGIDVNFVRLIPDGDKVRVQAVGDGDFCLRCFSNNGGSCVSVQSEISMCAEGLGKAYRYPYEELPAGLCEFRTEGCGEGIAHGIGFLGSEGDRKKRVIGFTGLDFGNFGTDEIELFIFANTNDPITFQIWEGEPEKEGSCLLSDCFYHKPPKWMVFQEQSYQLCRRIKGNAQIYLATGDEFQLRGIRFKKLEKAYARLYAGECDCIYGDAFERSDRKIERIGNNVTLEFTDLDFGERGADRITLCCHSDQKLNPVQIRFTTEEESIVQAVEVKESMDYGEQTFKLETLKGKGKLELIFLPGSCFDLEWLQFQYLK